MSTFLPTVLNTSSGGCFYWYYSTAVTGLSNGASVSTWIDNSGSGNTLSFSAGSGPNPTYLGNQLNGYPVINFSGGGTLVTASHSQSLEISPSSYSLYTVFCSYDPNTITQGMLWNGNKVGATFFENFGLGINYTAANSEWYISGGSRGTTGGTVTGIVYSLNPNSGVTGPGPISSGQFFIRADTYITGPVVQYPPLYGVGSGVNIPLYEGPYGDQAINSGDACIFGFNNYGTLLGFQGAKYSSLSAVGHPTTGSLLTLGTDSAFLGSHPFNGGMVELIGFNFNTFDYNFGSTTGVLNVDPWYNTFFNAHDVIVTYLSQKYGFSAGSQSIPLYISNAASASSGTPLFIDGGASITGTTTLFLENIAPSITGHITLYTSGLGFSANSITLYTENSVSNAVSHDFPLYVRGTAPPSVTGTCPLFITTISNASGLGSIPLYVSNLAPTISGLDLPLFIGNYGPWSASTSDFPLYTAGFIGSGISSVPLYLFNNVTQFGPTGIPLYTISNQYIPTGSGQGSMPLFLDVVFGSQIPLYIHGNAQASSGVPLYTINYNTASSGKPLFVHGIASASSIPPLTLYTYGYAPPNVSSGISLFLSTQQQLGISGFYSSIPLTVNAGSNRSSLPLYLQAQPIQLPSSFLPLFISATQGTGNLISTIPLFLENAYKISKRGFKLYTDGSPSYGNGLLYSSLPLFLDVINPIVPQNSSNSGGYFSQSFFGAENFNPNYFSPGNSPTFATVPGSSGFFTLYISGVSTQGQGIPLYTENIGPPASSTLTGFIWGSLSSQQNLPLYMSGIGLNNNIISLYTRGF